MSAERLFAWAAATAAAALFVAGGGLPALPRSVVAVGLGAVAVLPVVYALSGWLSPLVGSRPR